MGFRTRKDEPENNPPPSDEPTNQTGSEAANEQKNTPIDGGEAVATTDLQEHAKKVADDAQKIVDEGKSAPDLPATAANLAAFQNRETLSEDKRQQLEPTGGEKKEDEKL